MSKKKRIDKKSSRTAAYTCMCRAASYLERDPYLKSGDYVAVDLLPRLIKLLLKLRLLNLIGRISPAGIYPYVIARTKYIDDIFEKSVKAGFEQVAILGAGYDSRAIRFHSTVENNYRVFEIDAVNTQNAKIRQLKKRRITTPENNIHVSVDFIKENFKTTLNKAGFISGKKALFILEGLIMYLSSDAVDETFKLINDYSAPGSLIIFDYIYASVLRKEGKYFGEGEIYQRVKKDNEKWTFGIEEGKIESFLNSFNFSLLDHLDSIAIEKKYFTDGSGNLIAKVNGTHCIVLAEKN